LIGGDDTLLRILHITDLHQDNFGKETVYNMKQKFIDER